MLGQSSPGFGRRKFPGKLRHLKRTSQLRALLARKNDLTLRELREATGLQCSLQAINVVLGKLGLTYKKRRSAPASKTVPTLPGRDGSGANGRRALTRPG